LQVAAIEPYRGNPKDKLSKSILIDYHTIKLRGNIMDTNSTQPVVTTQITNNIGLATFSKPPVNALSHDVCSGLIAAFDEFEKASVRVVVLQANPKSKIWSAGHDVKEIPLDGEDPLPWTSGLEQLLHRVRNCPAPVIAMVHSSVWGGACDLAVTCDIVVGTAQATFAITPVKLGISYNTAGMTHFLGVLPLHIIKEMLYTGDPISADDAYRFGLLNHLVEPELLDQTAMQLANIIASRAPLAVKAIKVELRTLTSGDRMSADEFELIQSVRRDAFSSDDLKEGLKSFFEKRPPVFEGK
jgi:methylmalonyl-CoA decarboxylase